MKTLNEILSLQEQVDLGVLDLTMDEMTDLAKELHEKLDNYILRKNDLKSRAQFFKDEAKKLVEQAKAYETAEKYFTENLMNTLKYFRLERARGKLYQIKLGKSESVFINRDPIASDIVNTPELCHAKFSWNKTAIKDLLKNNDDLEFDFAHIEVNDRLTARTIPVK